MLIVELMGEAKEDESALANSLFCGLTREYVLLLARLDTTSGVLWIRYSSGGTLGVQRRLEVGGLEVGIIQTTMYAVLFLKLDRTNYITPHILRPSRL